MSLQNVQPATVSKYLSSRNLLIAGVARDCETTIEAEIRRLLAAVDCFGNISWFIVESDSTDDTLGILNKLGLTIPNFRFLSLGALRNEIPVRTARIAYCRNQYLRELRTNPLYENVDYLAVADLDGVNSQITSTAVQSCWLKKGWDVCCANRAGPYYDIWAVRHKEWSPNDCWSQYNFLLKYRPSHEAAFASAWSRMITIPEDNDWIEVDSAFGGFAIYRRSALADTASYIGGTSESYLGGPCEHVAFHFDIRRNGGSIFINPKLINGAETHHSKEARKLIEASRPEGATIRARRLILKGVKAIIGAGTYNTIGSYVKREARPHS
jgi:hypothetical protein